jgi:hypothetical protein
LLFEGVDGEAVLGVESFLRGIRGDFGLGETLTERVSVARQAIVRTRAAAMLHPYKFGGGRLEIVARLNLNTHPLEREGGASDRKRAGRGVPLQSFDFAVVDHDTAGKKNEAPAWDRGPRKARFVASVVFTPAAWGHPS